MSDTTKKYFCPRLLDYVILVGPRTSDMCEGQTSPSLGGHNRIPHLLRRYPPENHQDFVLPPDVVIFCQPEGCDRVESTLNAYNNPSQTTNSFVFLLTEKDTSRVRYGVCLNFYRPLQRCPHKPNINTVNTSSEWFNEQQQQQQQQKQPASDQQHASDTVTANFLKNDDRSKDNQSICSTQDNESGIKIDSDSVGSSGLMTSGSGNVQQSSKQLAAATNLSSFGVGDNISGGAPDSIISSNSGSRNQNSTNDGSDQNLTGKHKQLHHHHHSHHHHHHHHNQQRQHQSRQHQSRQHQTGRRLNTPTTAHQDKSKITYALNSICVISHHPFFSTFRECLFIIKKFIQACDDRNVNLIGSKDSQPKCKCYLRQLHKVRRNSQQSHLSQASRRSVSNYHSHSCPYSNPIWALLTMPDLDETTFPPSSLSDVSEIEAWVLRLLSLPAPIPERTKIEVEVMSMSLKQPLLFALPDHTRFSLIDFPLHLPLELLGVQTCLQVLTCILLEHKVALQSKDYNALSMSVMAFVTMIYPLEYMFPVIPLLPSCMSSAEQLLLAPTPFIIGFPSSFFKFKFNFSIPNDVWIVDLDANKVKKPPNVEDLPPLPEYEGAILIQNLQKILNSMSGVDSEPGPPSSSGNLMTSVYKSPLTSRMNKINEGQSSMPSSPYKRKSSMASAGSQLLQFAADKLGGSTVHTKTMVHSPTSSTRSSFASIVKSVPAFDPTTIIKNDTNAVDVATRIAMVRFFNSQEVLANFIEHTRTIRLYPRPVVSFQKSSFIQSRAKISPFLMKLVETQAVEYMAEWALCPDNVAFQRIQTGVYDPAIIGDKPKWYGNQLEPLKYQIWDSENKEFYEEIAALIRDSSSISGAASSTGKFSDYYDDTLDKANEEQSDLDEDDLQEHHGIRVDATPCYDVNNNVLDEDSHSPYLSSNDSSPCYSSDRETETNWNTDKLIDGRAFTLNDVMNMRMRKSSMSSSVSSNGSWDSNQMMQSIPAYYQHDVGRFPPIRCDITKHFRPSNMLVYSLDETPKQNEEATDQSRIDNRKHRVSMDSSDDENDSSKVIPDSSSCDESSTEEFDFTGVGQKTSENPPNLGEDEVVKLFESVDSDTVVTASSKKPSTDAHSNSTKPARKSISDDASVDSLSMASSSEPVLSASTEHEKPIDINQLSASGISTRSDTVNAILSSQKHRVTTGMAKLIDRASSIENKFLRQGSQGNQNQSPIPKNLGGEQVGAFFDRFTSEARDAVKEARAAIDAGKNVLKTTAIPGAGVGRQKILKNFQNIGEAFFDDRRDSSATGQLVEDAIISHEVEPLSENLNKHRDSQASIAADLNGIAGKANSMISGWLGSKATGFANRMRDRTRPLGPFPSSKYNE